jgi:sulfur relay (sulfurtransferase) complex TusBCD TusD component (DsrE family)
MTKKQQLTLDLCKAMVEKRGVIIIGDGTKTKYLIQRVNLDGECDLYSLTTKEVIAMDVPAKELEITKTTLKP